MFGDSIAFSNENVPSSFLKYRLEKYIEGGELYLDPKISSKKITIKVRYVEHSIISFTINNIIYGVAFDEGLSDNPSFILFVLKNNKWKDIGTTTGYRLFISSSGNVYSEGDINDLFNAKRKYKLTNSKFKEIRQSLLLVDRDCNTNALAKIRADENDDSEIIAILPAGNPIKIIACKFFYSDFDIHKEINRKGGYPFLVSTSFGLTGWVNIKPGYVYRRGTPVSCIHVIGP